MKTVFLWILLVTGASLLLEVPVRAQSPLEERGSNVPDDPYAWALYTFDAPADIDDSDSGNGEVTQHDLDLCGAYPFIWDDPLMFAAGVHFKLNRFEFEDTDIPNLDLYTLAVPLLLVYEGYYPWKFVGDLRPGVYSDFKSVGDDDLRLLGSALAFFPLSDTFSVAAGGSYDQVFGRDRLFPMGGFVWDPSPAWQVRMILPMPRVSYSPRPGLVTYVEVEPAGGNWSLTEDGEQYEFLLETLRASVGAEVAINDSLWFVAAAGMNMDRSYEIRQNSGEGSFDAEDAVFARIGLLVR